MRLECIEFKRCCFCLPLRYGLLVTGYLKLALCALILLGIVTQIIYTASNYSSTGRISTQNLIHLIFMSVVSLVILLEIALTIVFIVGGHKKDPRLMSIYYYYSVVLMVLFVLLFVVLLGFQIYSIMSHFGIAYLALVLKENLLSGLTNIGFEVYMILLTKSEIEKLKRNHTFRFVNNAAEGECSMVKEIGDVALSTDEPIVEDVKRRAQEDLDTLETVNEKVDTKKKGNYVKLV